MQLEIIKPSQASPVEWNHEALKAEVSERMASYRGVVYTMEMQGEAKKDRAALNKLLEALDSFRREEKRKALAGFEQTEKQIAEIKALIIPCRDEIDAQEKKFTEFKKQEKREKIETELYGPMIGDLAELVPYKALHDPKWLNVSFSMGAVANALAKKIEHITGGLEAIEKMDYPPDLKEQTKLSFLKGFDLSAAMSATNRIIEMREAMARHEATKRAQEAPETANYSCPEFTRPKEEKAAEVHQQAQSAEEKIHTVSFRIHVTTAQIKALGEFMRANGIKPERI